MGIDWEEMLGAEGEDLADAYAEHLAEDEPAERKADKSAPVKFVEKGQTPPADISEADEDKPFE